MQGQGGGAATGGGGAQPAGAGGHHGPLSCVIVEDQAMFLDMLGGMLSMRGGLRVVDRARSVAAGKRCCEQHRPDLLVLDLTLADGSGLEVARVFLQANPAGKVIVVSGNSSDFVCPAWLNNSLQAVIDKNETFQALRQELDELLGPARAAQTVHRGGTPAELLTAREAEIFALIGDGFTSREIGDQLSISEQTVQTHRKRIAAKLGTHGDELTRLAVAQRQSYLARPAE
jgi:DNA-binding NarL/FixJ family response regulator